MSAPRSHMLRALAVAAALAACLARAGRAEASALDIYGYGARGISMGSAHTAVADDHTAAYYNPARLVNQRELSLAYGYSLYAADLDIDTRRDGDVTPEEPPTFSGLALGLVFPFGGKMRNRLGLGLSLYLPTERVLRLEILDPVVPQFYLYQSQPERLALLVALGVRVADFLSVGAGVQVLAALAGRAEIALDLVNRKVTRKTIGVDLEPRAAPTAGISARPAPWIDIGLVWRGALDLDFERSFLTPPRGRGVCRR